MKTKMLLVALCSCLFYTASAQEFKPRVGSSEEAGYKTSFKKNKAGDNWFISIAGGASVLMGDINSEEDFGKRLNFAPQISVGKWFNPHMGFRAQLYGGQLYSNELVNYGVEKHKYAAGHVDLLWDVTNYWAPYNEKKVFRLIPWVGLGYAHRFKTDADDNRAYVGLHSPTVNFGILTAFRLSKRLDLNVEIQNALVNEQMFSYIETSWLNSSIMQLSAGLTFKLGKTDFEVLEPMDYNLLNDLNGQINSLRAENEELSKRPESCPEVAPAVTNVTNNYVDNVVYFRLNSATIDKPQQINIFNTAQFVKEKNAPILVIGYADKRTGNSDYNMKLSEKRARAVAKELIEKYGISSNQISIEYRGSEEQPFNENNWNRVVIMRAAK